MITVFLLSIVSLSIVSTMVFAEKAKTDGNSEMDDGAFADYLKEDPAQAFNINPRRAFQAIERNNDLLQQPDIASAAFNQNTQKTADIINKNPVLLDHQAVITQFDTAIVSDISIANNNPGAKSAWLFKKYHLVMVDKGVPLVSYNGESITTGRIGGTTFTPADFPRARILENGCLEQDSTTFCSAKVSIKKGPRGGKMYTEGFPNYEVSSGRVEIADNKNMYLYVNDAEVQIQERGTNAHTIYTGSFRFVQDQEGMLIKSACQQACTKDQWVMRYSQKLVSEEGLQDHSLEFIGTIEDLHHDEYQEFAVSGNSELRFGDGDILTTRTDRKVYYTERDAQTANAFCAERPAFSCVVNSHGENRDPDYRDKLGFRQIQNGDEITFSSPAYHSSVSTDVQDGIIHFISREKRDDGQYYDLAQVTVGKGDDISVKGNLEAMKAGRFDARHIDVDGTSLLTHWSSNGFQKEDTAKYFAQPHNQMVTCALDDCEQAFAKAFGKVLGPPGKDPELTLLVAGDNAFTASAMEAECQRVGCYILNSRDSPPLTKSRELILTGHHWGQLRGGGTDYIWRDSPEQMGTIHNPIDRLYFEELPQGRVETVRFSACNTVIVTSTGRTHPGFEKLRDHYPNLRFVQGWNMIGLRQEYVPRPTPEKIGGHLLERPPDPKTGIPRGQRAWYVFREPPGEWVWTNGKKEQVVSG